MPVVALNIQHSRPWTQVHIIDMSLLKISQDITRHVNRIEVKHELKIVKSLLNRVELALADPLFGEIRGMMEDITLKLKRELVIDQDLIDTLIKKTHIFLTRLDEVIIKLRAFNGK